MLTYKKYSLGELPCNCYLVWDSDSKETAIIDPGDEGGFLAEEIQNLGLKPKIILASHGHFDHTLGALELKLIFKIPFACHQADFFLLAKQEKTASYFYKRQIKIPNIKTIDIDLSLKPQIKLGTSIIEVIETPGHTPGSVCFYCKEEKLLFSGDTLFKDGPGSSEHKYSSAKLLKESIVKLQKLGDGIELLAGHN